MVVMLVLTYMEMKIKKENPKTKLFQLTHHLLDK